MREGLSACRFGASGHIASFFDRQLPLIQIKQGRPVVALKTKLRFPLGGYVPLQAGTSTGAGCVADLDGKEELYMGILDELIGGGQRQKEYRDFVDRYEQGDPSEGYSDQEVLNRYGDVSHAVPPDQYAQAAIEALGKLSPEERAAFVKMLQQRAEARGVALPQIEPEPKDLGQVLTDLHGKPGQLRDILGSGDAQPQEQAQPSNPIIDILASPQAKAVLAGIAAMVVKRVMQGSSRTA